MATAVTLLLIGCLLQGSVYGQFEVTVPRNIEVLSGSCVTIPCSFTINKNLERDLDRTCKALWLTVQTTLVFDSRQQTNKIKGELIGDLTKKDCTTRLDNLQPEHSNKYYFRLDCFGFKYSYWKENFETNISVKADPPEPTLAPSTVLVSEGTQVRLKCSAPAPCQSNPPNLTWTSSLGDSKEKLQENQDKTEVKISVLTFTANRLHHTKKITCTAVYSKQNGSIESSVSVKANVTFVPEILASFVCTKATDQLICSCETVGNPFPTLQWYLDGLRVNQSDGFTVSNEPFNDTGLRSVITLDQPQWRNISTLVCHSSNSLGSAWGRFYVYRLEPQTCTFNQDLLMLTVFIATVVALVCVILVILACALLLIIRAQKTHSLPTGAVTMSQIITSEEGNEEPNTTEEDIYANVQRQANVVHPAAISEANSTILPNSGLNKAEGAGKSSEEEGGSDVVYSAVKWKSKGKRMNGKNSKRKDHEEERRSYRNFVDNAVEMGNIYDNVGNVNGEEVYTQVKIKNKNSLHK